MHPSARRGSVVVAAVAAFLLVSEDCLAAPADATRKMAEIRARAEHGYVQQQIELAAAYLAGRGVPQNSALAAHWYLKAAESGSPEAENQIGYFYQTGIGVQVDLERAVHWFQLASAAGMGSAKVNLGVSYLRGEGVRANAATARQLFVESVDKGVGLGATYLGVMDYFGVGGPVDKAAGVHWFETGARLHDPQSAYDLAVLSCESDSGARDLRRASELLRFSASKGYVAGKHALGLLLVNHPEFAASENEALVELKEASDAGNWKSSAILGVLERDGKYGGAPNPPRAYFYFHLAALQGGKENRQLVSPDLAALEKKLSPEQRTSLAAEAESQFEKNPTPMMFVLKEDEPKGGFPMVAATDIAPHP